MPTPTAATARPWLKFYPAGIPAEINPDAYPSLGALFDEACRRFADRPAYACMGRTLTFGELDALTAHFAAYLQQELGLRPGERLALQSPNLLPYPVALFGALRAGLTIVNTNPLYTPREMRHQFADSGARAIVILSHFAGNLEQIVQQTSIEHVILTQPTDLLLPPGAPAPPAAPVPAGLPGAVAFGEALRRGGELTLAPVAVQPTDVAFLQYTGGTTGVSKGAILTHRNVIANVEGQHVWNQPLRQPDGTGIVVTALPLYHIYGLTTNALAALKSGVMNLLIPNPRDMEVFINTLKQYPFTMFSGVNTLYNGLVNHPRIKEVDFSHLLVASAGGMALQTVVAEKWVALTGQPPCEGYGLSETSPVLTCNPLDGTVRVGTIGLPWPSTDLKIVRDDDSDADLGEAGEIVARGPQVFAGYYQRPEATAEAMLHGEWFRTGDIGVQDADGFFRIVDRKKDMLLVSGFNVYPNEVEEVLAQCPGVLEVACIGVPDAHSGEAVKVFVVKQDPALTAETVLAYARQHLTPYKVPHQLEFRAEVPKSNVGKILRRVLREEAAAPAS